jgi:NADH dehydrogenase [ubiquinone] 1 alpha subcomplex assembly factor 7
MTALAGIIRQMIAEDGPMPIDRYMGLCLGHPQHGYYMTRDPFGRAGDFTTAPEISQVFGELIGVWVAQVWQLMGEPRHFALVELGPGRGTLMADILRVLAKAEKCLKAASVQFVETSPVLRDAQASRVPQATWHHTVASLPPLPTILIANEFFDALPIRQFERKQGRIFERCVGLAGDNFAVGLVPSPQLLPFKADGVFEDGVFRNTVAAQLADHLKTLGGAALVIDYGHLRSALGDTLQALRNHAPCEITHHPGDADITSHVDFETLGRSFVRGGARLAGVMTQGDFLNAMGLEARTQRLAQSLNGEAQAQFLAASNRLAAQGQMGEMFKCLAVTSPDLPPPYPFGAANAVDLR